MSEQIRHIAPAEFDSLMQLLHASFGAASGFFPREFPHLYQPDPEACSWANVLEADGRFVAHVGVYPLEMRIRGTAMKMGGIGAVGTLPEARGRHHMSRLLGRAIEVMREQGYPASALGGDRLRYGAYGWEQAGLRHPLAFDRRSLDRGKVEAAPLQEVGPDAALPVIERLYRRQACHVLRPRLPLQVRKQNRRFWLSDDDGYAISTGADPNTTQLEELVSADGREAQMIRGILERAGTKTATWSLPAADTERLARVLPHACWWGWATDWQYRLVDLEGVMRCALPMLDERAGPLKDGAASLVMREHDRTQAVTMTVAGGRVEVSAGAGARERIELAAMDAARLAFGGPPPVPERDVPPIFRVLFPLPVHVPPFDHV